MHDCPNCRATIVDLPVTASGDRCPQCGHPITSIANPYEAPGVEIAPEPEPMALPVGYVNRVATAFLLFVAEFPLIAGLLLLCELPVTIVGVWLAYSAESASQTNSIINSAQTLVMQLTYVIAQAGIFTALAGRVAGRRLSFTAALSNGLSGWGRLLVTHLLAGLLIILGFVLLIVPGIVLMIRYYLIEPIAVLERTSASSALGRSNQLVRGRGFRLLVELIPFGLAFLVFTLLVEFVFETACRMLHLAPGLAAWSRIVPTTLAILASGYFPALKFVYYWEFCHRPVPVAERPSADAGETQVAPWDSDDEPNFGL